MSTAHQEQQLRRLMQDEPGLDGEELLERLRRQEPLTPTSHLQRVISKAKDRANRFGPVTDLLQQPDVTDVCINGPGEVFVDRSGLLQPAGVMVSAEDIDVLVERMLDPLGLRLDRTSPMVDARLSDGSRVNVIAPPLAGSGTVVTIRRFASTTVSLDSFGPPSLVELLNQLVDSGANILVTGATGAGKTTLLNALGNRVPASARVITIEDTAELSMPSRHVVSLEARPANAEGVGEVSIRQLVRNALRMRPDRLVVGEVRGPEALDLLLALNSGHSGSLATCHGHGVQQCLARLGVLAQLGEEGVSPAAVDALIRNGIDHVVHVARVAARRLVTAVAVVEDRGAPRLLWEKSDHAS